MASLLFCELILITSDDGKQIMQWDGVDIKPVFRHILLRYYNN